MAFYIFRQLTNYNGNDGMKKNWNFRDGLKKSVTTIPDECKGVECLLVRHSKRIAV